MLYGTRQNKVEEEDEQKSRDHGSCELEKRGRRSAAAVIAEREEDEGDEAHQAKTNSLMA